MKNEELKSSWSKFNWLGICVLFLLFFSTRLHSSPTISKVKPEFANTLFTKTATTISTNAQFKVWVPFTENNLIRATYYCFEEKRFTTIKLPATTALKKKKLLRFRHHLKPGENEDLPS